jgi:predicted permease
MWSGIKELPAPLRKLNFDPLRSQGYSWVHIVGRLKTGIGIKAVRGPLNEISARLHLNVGPMFRKTIDVAPIQLARLPQQYQGSMPLMITVIFVVVAGLLLIACANVASLLIGRAFARQKEIAIRLALGARRAHIVRELLTESMLLAAIGGGAGILVALWLVSAFESLRPLLPIPIPVDLGLDFRVLGFTVAVTLLSGLAVGVLVAIQTTCVDSAGRLKEVQSAAGADRRPLSTRKFLVIGQVALSLMLLAGAGLLLRTFFNLQSIAIGFDPHNLILLNADFVRHGHSEASAIAAYQRLLEQVQSLPGVKSASLAQYVPLTSTRGVWKYDEQKRGAIQINGNKVTPGYFQTMSIPLLRGRDFKPEDRDGVQKVAIVNEAYAQVVLKGGDPIGRYVDGSLIIGLVKDNKNESLRQSIEPWWFAPFLQSPEPRMSVVIRTIVDPRSMIETVYHAALKVDPAIPTSSVRLMTDQIKGLLWQPRIAAILVGAFALLAALLAVVGVYGAVSFDVSRRSHEIGIRMALGADRGNVLRMVLARGVLLGSTGAGLGILAALGLSRLLASMLYGVGPNDPIVFAMVAILLVLVAAMASLIPARRATSVNPIEVLRHQ